MNKSGFTVKRPMQSDVALQITSMADIFIILLVFLLKSFGSGAINIMPSPGLELPLAFSGKNEIQALQLEISQNAIQVDKRPVTPLQDYRFEPKDLRPSGLSASLDSALEKQKKKQELISQVNTDVELDAKILIIADGKTPYTTLKSVLSSATIHGFTDFKLVVRKKE